MLLYGHEYKTSHFLMHACSIVQLHGLQPARLLCPWDAPGKNTGVVALPSSRVFSQPKDRTSSPYRLYCRQIFYPLGSLFSHFYSIFLMFFPLIKMLSFLRSIFTYHILLWFSSQVVFFVKPPWLFIFNLQSPFWYLSYNTHYTGICFLYTWLSSLIKLKVPWAWVLPLIFTLARALGTYLIPRKWQKNEYIFPRERAPR